LDRRSDCRGNAHESAIAATRVPVRDVPAG
jgi:hypothetical protein